MSRYSLRARLVLLLLGQIIACWLSAAQAQQENLTDFPFFVERVSTSTECTMTLKSTGDPQQVAITTPDGHRRSYFVEAGASFFDGGRFASIQFEKKEAVDADGHKKDVSELRVRDKLRKEQMTLVMNVPVHFPMTPEAVLEWRRNTTETIKVKEGAQFQMPGGSNAPCRLIRVEETSAIIAPILPDGSLGKEVVIQKK
jgi:hypothetical protein